MHKKAIVVKIFLTFYKHNAH